MKNQLRVVVGVVLSLLLLYWSLRDVSFGEVVRRIREADYALFTLSVLVMLSGFWIRAFRWGILLLPVAGKVPFRPRLAATFIGFGVNNLLPARVGEVARVYSLSKLTNVRVGSGLATLVIERLLDGFTLIALLFLAIAAPGFPESGGGGLDVQSGATAAALIMGTVGLALMASVLAPTPAARIARAVVALLPVKLRGSALAGMRSFASGLAVLRDPKLFLLSAVLAVGQWTFLATGFLLGFRAFDIGSVPFSGSVFLQSLISLAVAIPSSPGFFGPFEAGARIGLGLYGVPGEQAVSFAIGYHIGGFIPVTVIALLYIWRLNLGWSTLRSAEVGDVPPDELNDSSGEARG